MWPTLLHDKVVAQEVVVYGKIKKQKLKLNWLT